MFNPIRRPIALSLLSTVMLVAGCTAPVTAPTAPVAATGGLASTSDAPAPAPAAPAAAVTLSPTVTLSGKATYHGEALAGYRLAVYDAVTGMQLLTADAADAVPHGVRAVVAPLDGRTTGPDGSFTLRLANVAATDFLRVIALKGQVQVDGLVDAATLLGATPATVALDENTQTSALLMSGILAVANRQALGGAIGADFVDKAKRTVLDKKKNRRAAYHLQATASKSTRFVAAVQATFNTFNLRAKHRFAYQLLAEDAADFRTAEPELYASIVALMQSVTEPADQRAVQQLLNDPSVSDGAARLFFDIGHAFPDLAWLAAAQGARRPSEGAPASADGDPRQAVKTLKSALLDCFATTYGEAAQAAAILEVQNDGLMQTITDANVELLQALAASPSTGGGADLRVKLPGTQLEVAIGSSGKLTVQNTVSGQQVDATSGSLAAVSTVVHVSSSSGGAAPAPALKLHLDGAAVALAAPQLWHYDANSAEILSMDVFGFDFATLSPQSLTFSLVTSSFGGEGPMAGDPVAFKRWNFSDAGDLVSVEPLTVSDQENDAVGVVVTEGALDEAKYPGATRHLHVADAQGHPYGDFYYDGDQLLYVSLSDGQGGTYFIKIWYV